MNLAVLSLYYRNHSKQLQVHSTIEYFNGVPNTKYNPVSNNLPISNNNRGLGSSAKKQSN
jgi:hypothetical protein